MPGGGPVSPMNTFILGSTISAYPAAVTLLSGYCQYHARKAELSSLRKILSYSFSYLLFFFLNAPLLILYEYTGSPFPFIFFGVVMASFAFAFRRSPPAKKWFMYLPALMAYLLCFGLFMGEMPDNTRRWTEKKKLAAAANAEYDQVMIRLRDPRNFIRADVDSSQRHFQERELPLDSFAANLRVPVPYEYAVEDVPQKKGEPGRHFRLAFRDIRTNGSFTVILKKEPVLKSQWQSVREHPDLYGRNDPFFEGSVFQQFEEPEGMFFDTAYTLSECIVGVEYSYDDESTLIPDDVASRVIDRRNRVVHYDNRVIISRFPGTIAFHQGRGEKISRRVTFLFAALYAGDAPITCLVFFDREEPPGDPDMPLAWILELQRINNPPP